MNNSRKLKSRVPFAAALGLASIFTFMLPTAAQVSIKSVVVPNNRENVEANGNNAFPFNLGATQQTSQRYQQVYSKFEFPTGSPLLITRIVFRPSGMDGSNPGGGAAFSATIPNIQINLSTTLAIPDGLSQTFANNVGSDDTVVFNGALALSSSFVGPLTGPKDFDIVINLTSPFLYNPAEGNLLLDVRNFSNTTTVFFDLEFSDDSISRVFSIGNGFVNSPTGQTDSAGLVTRFEFLQQPVPGPADLAVINLSSPNPVAVGDFLTYQITVINNGPNPAHDVVITDTLSPKVVLNGVSSVGTCSGYPLLTCNLGTIPSGGYTLVRIIAKPLAAGLIMNTVTVMPDSSLTPDLYPFNNSFTNYTRVTQR